jgi:hypothetical protein
MKDRPEDLETLLSTTPHIADDGFTDALMARLPAHRPTLRVRSAILLGSAVASCGIAAAVPGARQIVSEIGLELAGGSVAATPSLLVTAAVVALLVWGAVAAATSEV